MRTATALLAAAASSALLLHPLPALAQSTASGAPALDDPTIVAIFDATNTAEVETGKLAAERGQDPKVREFGAMLERDHKAVRQQGRDLATKLGVTPTPPADDAGAKAHAKVMKELRALRGAEFDRAFLRHEATFHRDVIQAVQSTLLPATRNEEVKALVLKVIPAFRGHMLAAQQLERELGHSNVP